MATCVTVLTCACSNYVYTQPLHYPVYTISLLPRVYNVRVHNFSVKCNNNRSVLNSLCPCFFEKVIFNKLIIPFCCGWGKCDLDMDPFGDPPCIAGGTYMTYIPENMVVT